MARTVDDAFNVFISWLIPLESQRAAASSHRATVESAIADAMQTLAFRQTGSFWHGTGVRHHCDVDLLVSVGGARPGSSHTALRWINDALNVRFPYTPVYISRPAVVVDFAQGAERWEVIPGFLTGRGGSGVVVYDIPAPSGGWLDSAPIEHLDYVNECDQIASTAGGAKRLARLAKAWKYYNTVPISSFYLEMRAAQHVATQTAYIDVWDICQLLEKLYDHQLADMNDPKGAAARFSACSSAATRAEALSKLTSGAARARRALDAYRGDKTDTAFTALDLLFGGRFPSRNG